MAQDTGVFEERPLLDFVQWSSTRKTVPSTDCKFCSSERKFAIVLSKEGDEYLCVQSPPVLSFYGPAVLLVVAFALIGSSETEIRSMAMSAGAQLRGISVSLRASQR